MPPETPPEERSVPAEYLGQWLREYREAGGVTLRDLAQRLEMDETTLSKIEKGKRPAPPMFRGRYMDAVQAIVTERAIRVGIIPPPKQ
jgi:ribosome-binding protein aMBF1 (putative translation factor)